ncbi:MAG: protein O-mannosyl-transferase family [Anaerolineae bacterium]
MTGATLAFYIATLAPTVVWGDDATFQLAAVTGELHASAGSHPAWIALAHLFTKLPVGELGYRVNLAAAFSAALAIGCLYMSLHTLRLSRLASVAGSLALAVSHTFWAHAVRPETYALTLATMGLLVWATLRWYYHGQIRELILLGVAWGLALSTHALALLYVPAIVWLFVARRQHITWRALLVLGIVTLIALTPLGWLLWRDSQALGMGPGETLRWALFTFNGYDFSGQMLNPPINSFAADTGQWLLFLSYQFVGPAVLLGVVGFVHSWRRLSRDLAVFIGLLYLVAAAFAFSYQVGDRYVFYLPSYLAFAIWVALGAEHLLTYLQHKEGVRRLRLTLIALLIGSIVATPVLAYRVTPGIMEQLGISFREGRYVPGPNSRYFILWPPKNGYYDARNYAEAALASAPANALLLADPVLATPMVYLQQVEGLRQDVTVRFCCWDIDQVLREEAERPLALADNWPEIYPIDRLQHDYRLSASGPIYVLIPKHR